MTGVEPHGAGWSQAAVGQQGDAGFEQLGLDPRFAQQMWLAACSSLHAHASARDSMASVAV